MSKEVQTIEENFYFSGQMDPYQDAIAFALKTHDYHMELASRGHSKDFHLKQANRMKSWIIDMKDYILKLENELNV